MHQPEVPGLERKRKSHAGESLSHNLIVYGKEGNDYLISDPVAEDPQRCDAESLRKARFATGLMALAAELLLVMAGSAFAAVAISGDVAVTATVSSGCSAIVGGPIHVDIDPATLGASDAISTGVNPATVQCVKHNVAGFFTVDAFSAGSALTSNTGSLIGRLKSVGLTPIPYTLTFTASFDGNGFGGPEDGSHTPWGKPAMDVVARWYLRGGR